MTPPLAISGYPRADGRIGLRDHVLVLSTVSLVNRWAELAAIDEDGAAFEGALVVAGETVRGLRGGDAAALDALLCGLVRHPNVGAAVVLTQDAIAAKELERELDGIGKPVEVLALLDQDGWTNAIGAARVAVRDAHASRDGRVERAELAELTVGLECGGSDPTSALASNPAIGRFVDRLVDAGGTAIVSETAEFIGAEAIVEARCPDRAVRGTILDHIARRERWHAEDGEDYRGTNPTAENIAGGLTTLIEKSMGAITKTGTRPFAGALRFGEAPARPGLHFMDSPFYTPLSMTGMVQGGANLVLFGIGQFNPSASPLAPTIKVCGNAGTVRRWGEAIDVDASPVLSGDATIDGIADRIGGAVAATSEGQPTAAERWNEGQFITPRNHAPL